jgi:hypothetical protein
MCLYVQPVRPEVVPRRRQVSTRSELVVRDANVWDVAGWYEWGVVVGVKNGELLRDFRCNRGKWESLQAACCTAHTLSDYREECMQAAKL